MTRKADRRWNTAIETWVASLSPDELRMLAHDWRSLAHRGQLPPPGDWQTWLLMAGRGFGKTRAGAEWARGIAECGTAQTRIALVANSDAEARAVMIEGESGILSCAPVADRPQWEPARGMLTWRSGAQAAVYSGNNPEKLRGPQHSHAWCDELAKWPYAQSTWDNLQFGLRLGDTPRALVTTTPRSIAVLRVLLADNGVVVTRGTTRDNLNLPVAFVRAVETKYAGTRLGRQELDGELIDDVEGALWTRDVLEACRVREAPELMRVVIGVDPPAGTLSGNRFRRCAGGGGGSDRRVPVRRPRALCRGPSGRVAGNIHGGGGGFGRTRRGAGGLTRSVGFPWIFPEFSHFKLTVWKPKCIIAFVTCDSQR